MSIPASSPKWSHLPKDVQMDLKGMDHMVEVSAEKCRTEIKATFKDEGDKGRWLPVNVSSASAEFLLPTPTVIDKAKLVDHIK